MASQLKKKLQMMMYLCKACTLGVLICYLLKMYDISKKW
ncbi:hypothetical protein bas30_0123 [Escherichia phage TrudiRoth]|uniref:Uncharacterized protein n=1 Tax=Escherichia phage TrudiRoth TaxID=2851994 RepID=A0AAE8B416_9CAUD|nr:hypothetical protein bas30_0123 [Escherichia phage TrudiRoth]